ncbi:MAG: anaerobic ribonucleoside-triphosphate reductase activating protein [Oscillospiraceae bacterium]|nr:anaerobic ribonucleoside-triphosphate reductase activating protein [Oscillospiraceae bacterium]
MIIAIAIERINNMIFGGIHKLTLLDYPEQTACTVYTIGCNFLCPFCQNVSLIVEVEEQQSDITQANSKKTICETEVLEFLETRRGLLDGICIGGGEPLLHEGLESFIDKIKALGFLVKLDTNGSFPDKLENLIKNGEIDYVAMDIKNAPEKYAKTIGMAEYDISPIEKSMKILHAGAVPYEFRTTVVHEFHSLDDLLSIARWISWADKYYLQSFINSDGVFHKGLTAYSDTDMQVFLAEVKKILPCTELRG